MVRPKATCLLLFLAVTLSSGASQLAVGQEALPEVPTAAVQFLERYCIDCHQGDEGEAGVDFFEISDVDRFQRDRLAFEAAMRAVATRSMPPAEATSPEQLERESFLEVMQAFYQQLDAALPPQPGRVTMRRLNRTEYRNTIRDLIGVDFDPTEGFPSDDIGHGFDNVGEVLTLSPLLFERYLAASESIVARAIVPNPPAPPKRHLSSRYTEPAAAEVPMVGNFRQLSLAGDSVATGPIHTPYQWTADGEYVFRVKLYKRHPEPLKVAVMLWGGAAEGGAGDEELAKIVGDVRRPCRILKVVEVTAAAAETAELIEVAVPVMADRDRMAVGIVRPETPADDTAVFIEHLELEGPLDPRPESHRRLLATPEGLDDATRSRVVLERFLRRAYRRPATQEELDRSIERVAELMNEGQSWEAAMQWMIQATLCSPKFLFRVELDETPDASGVRELDAFQLASRLSYFLWSSMPDDELLDLAQSGRLLDNLDEQVTRMLADPKSEAFVDSFASQWLQIQRLEALALDPERFPQFDERLKRSMERETRMFFGAILRENRPVTELLDADFTFLNEPLAKLYGIADTQGNPVGGPVVVAGGEPIEGREFRRVSLQGETRGGLVTMASVLAVTSNPTRTSPVKRGRWVLEQILGAPPPPPPPDVPLLDEGEQAVSAGSLRERLEVHRRNPACANCHAKMDPIGFALENYDAAGAFRTHDGEFPIDASGEFADGKRFAGVGDLKQILLERRADFVRCLTEKLMIYALGRGMRYYDRPTILKIESDLAADGDRFQTLIQRIVASPPFRTRGPYQVDSEALEESETTEQDSEL